MSLLFGSRVAGTEAAELISRLGGRSSQSARPVSRETALRTSAVWACLRLRADLVSTMPFDVFRKVDGVQVEQSKPPVLVRPGGAGGVRVMEWLYSSQVDLDSVGNTFAIIRARDGANLPSILEPVPVDDVVVRQRDGITKYLIRGKEYPARDVWHEKQFTASGIAVGLSPIAYAAMTLDRYLNAAEFVADWFGGNATPAQHLKNTAKTLEDGQADKIKARYKASVETGGVFVSGNDWDLSMISAKASESAFIESMDAGVTDICRFLGVPGDMIDAPTRGSSVTYANVTQRNMQLLILNLGPALARREDAISADLLPQPRYIKFNPGSLLRMDLAARYTSYRTGIEGRFLTPNEARDYENLPPLTPEQEAEFARLSPANQPVPTGAIP